MEGKTVIFSVLIVLVMAQVRVEAKVCCRRPIARNAYNTCRLAGTPESTCSFLAGCIIVSGTTCPGAYPYRNLENSGDAVNEYCKLGCASSVCGSLTTLQYSGVAIKASETVNEAVENCNKACSTFCTKGFLAAVEAA